MAAASAMGFKTTALLGKPSLKLLCVHTYKLFNTSVEVNISVEHILTIWKQLDIQFRSLPVRMKTGRNKVCSTNLLSATHNPINASAPYVWRCARSLPLAHADLRQSQMLLPVFTKLSHFGPKTSRADTACALPGWPSLNIRTPMDWSCDPP